MEYQGSTALQGKRLHGNSLQFVSEAFCRQQELHCYIHMCHAPLSFKPAQSTFIIL